MSKLEVNTPSPETTPTLDVETDNGATTVFKMLEESVDEGDELQKILEEVRKGIDDRSIDENNYQQIHDEILRIKAEQQRKKAKKHVPAGVLNYINTLLFIEKEIHRSLRYNTPFSAITFSILDLKPQKQIPAGKISGNDISQSIMGELINLLRESDIVGILNKKMIVGLLPMTDGANARIALRRIRKKLHDGPIIINEIPIFVRFAGTVTTCRPESTPDLQVFLDIAEKNHNDLVIRLTNLNELM
jgi:PleD family two-component response regulator